MNAGGFPTEATRPGVLAWDDARGGPFSLCRLRVSVEDTPFQRRDFRWTFLVDERKPKLLDGEWYVTPGKHNLAFRGRWLRTTDWYTTSCMTPAARSREGTVRDLGSAGSFGAHRWRVTDREWVPWNLAMDFCASEGTTTVIKLVKTRKGGIFRGATFSLVLECLEAP